jgi:hypothetical protein
MTLNIDRFRINHDGRNEIAGAGKREKICREGRYWNDHNEQVKLFGMTTEN